MRFDWLATNVHPSWVPAHPWAAATARRVTAELDAGALRRWCPHVRVGARATRRVVDLAHGLAVCRGCFPEYLDALPVSVVSGRSCDGCLTRPAVVTAFIRPTNGSLLELLLAFCEACAVDGPVMDA